MMADNIGKVWACSRFVPVSVVFRPHGRPNRHVLKPQTTTQNERNETPEIIKTSETKPPKQTKWNHWNKQNETMKKKENDRKVRYFSPSLDYLKIV